MTETNDYNRLSHENQLLKSQNEEMTLRFDVLKTVSQGLEVQNLEREKHAAELVLINVELEFHNQEREKRAAELAIANIELEFQNTEKEKRAAELKLANIELLFQNKEKEKRALELTIAYDRIKKTEAYLKEYILGLEKMMFLTSHRVRQPVTNILGLADMLDHFLHSPKKLKRLVEYIKSSAISLDDFTHELTAFIIELEKKSREHAEENA